MGGWIIVVAVVVGYALYIVIRGVRDFIRTGGRSACKHCPYSGQCGGDCPKKPCKR